MDAEYSEVLEGKESDHHARFGQTCELYGLTLNAGKRLVGAVKGSLQGGLLDGKRGVFHASPEKLSSMVGYGMMLAEGKATEFELRHFVGKSLFNVAFRRQAMSIFESLFYDIERLQRH